jgi:hypothetical protein
MPGKDDEVSPVCDNWHSIEEPGGNPYAPPGAGRLQGAAPKEGSRLLAWLTATEGRMWRFIAVFGFAVTMVFGAIGAADLTVEVTPGSIRIAPAGSAHVAPIPAGGE